MMINLLTLIIISQNIVLNQADPVETLLKAHFANLNHIECAYKQEKKISMLNKPLISTGVFKYEKEGQIIWEQEMPFKETFLIKKTNKNIIERHINEFIISIINGGILSNPKLEIHYSEDEISYVVSINPKKKSIAKTLKKIILTFQKEKIKLNQLEIIAQNGDINKITFLNKLE